MEEKSKCIESKALVAVCYLSVNAVVMSMQERKEEMKVLVCSQDVYAEDVTSPLSFSCRRTAQLTRPSSASIQTILRFWYTLSLESLHI
jgi:hypothetical protein